MRRVFKRAIFVANKEKPRSSAIARRGFWTDFGLVLSNWIMAQQSQFGHKKCLAM
jgi:hypothetical protein